MIVLRVNGKAPETQWGSFENGLRHAENIGAWFSIEVRRGGREFSVCNNQPTLERAIERAHKAQSQFGGECRVTQLRVVVYEMFPQPLTMGGSI